MKESFETTLVHRPSNLWSYYILIPSNIAIKFISTNDANNRRVICNINQQHAFPCALMPSGSEGYFILINQQIRKKLTLQVGQRLQVELKKDASEYGMPIPEELKEIMAQDPEGSHFFHLLSLGKQRSLLYMIGKIKSENLRMERSWLLINYLKQSKGKLVFKELQLVFQSNQIN